MRLFEGTEFDVPPRCDRCNELEQDCSCPPLTEKKVWLPPSEQSAKVRPEKRKRGKFVTVVSGLLAAETDLPNLVTILKNHCGAGGTVREDTIEIQGDQSQKIEAKLTELGYRLRR